MCQNYFDLSLNVPVTITRWWSVNLDATAFYTTRPYYGVKAGGAGFGPFIRLGKRS